jgi:hypothetical protein
MNFTRRIPDSSISFDAFVGSGQAWQENFANLAIRCEISKVARSTERVAQSATGERRFHKLSLELVCSP